MSKINKNLVMRIGFAFAIVLIVALALAAMIGTAGATESTGTVTIQGADSPVYPSPAVTTGVDTGIPAVPSYVFGTINITGTDMFKLNVPQTANAKCYVRTLDLTGSPTPFSVHVSLGQFSDGSSHTISAASVTLFTNVTSGTPQIPLMAPAVGTSTIPAVAGTYQRPTAPEERVPTTALNSQNALLSPSTNEAPTPQGTPTAGVTLVSSSTPIASKLISANRQATGVGSSAGKGEWWTPTAACLYIPASATGVGSYSYTATLTWTIQLVA